MQKPLIYISYGMAKSGSTLAFQLVNAILEEAGVAQEGLDYGPTADGRFIGVIRPQELKRLAAIAADRDATPIAVKTHSGLWNCVTRGLDEGWVIGHAVCRDPRDIALSMMDASREQRAWGKRDGQPLRHVEDALDYVRAHAEKFEKWASHPGVLHLPYEPLAFDTETTAAAIAAQLGVEVDLRRCVKVAKASFTQLNKGRSRRYETELSAEVSRRIADEFAGFIERWCAPDFVAPKRGLLARITGI